MDDSKFLAFVTPTLEDGECLNRIAMVAELTDFTKDGQVEILLPGNGSVAAIYVKFSLSSLVSTLSRFGVDTE